jgi:hypothetical protein
LIIAAPWLIRGGDAPFVQTASFANQLGGYRLEYPVGWTATAMSATTRVASAERDVVVGIGRAPAGSLASASRAFTAAVLRVYRQVRIGSRTEQEVAERDAVLFAGTGVNATGVSVRWLTVTMRDGGRNLGVSVFTRADSDPERLLPMLHTLIGSIEPIGTRTG